MSVDWQGVFNAIFDIARGILGGIGDFLDGVFATTAFTNLVTAIDNVVEAIEDVNIQELRNYEEEVEE